LPLDILGVPGLLPKEHQEVASGTSAELGRTAGGVVNVISKSGTNETHGSVFFFGRNEAPTGDLSDGSRLENFRREHWGGTIGGPIRKDELLYFFAPEYAGAEHLAAQLDASLPSRIVLLVISGFAHSPMERM
jgi:hypothetical protein